MEYRQLGQCGLRISRLTLGTMGFGGSGMFSGVGEIDLAGARRQIDMAIDAGVNLIDTADIYSLGASEQLVGEALAGRRDDVLLATKARFSMGAGPNDAGLSRHHLIEACEASLRRLQTDHIDLYQVHEWDGQTPLEETLGALEHLVDSGKVRYVGCSNFAGWQVMKALGHRRSHRPAAVRQPAGLPLAAGALGRVRDRALGDRPGARPADLEPARRRAAVRQVPARPAIRRRARATPASGASRRSTTRSASTTPSRCSSRSPPGIGVSAAQVALAWLLARPGVTSVIVGARTEEQLADNLAAADARAQRGGAGAPGGGQPPAAALSVLASQGRRLGPPWRGRPRAA